MKPSLLQIAESYPDISINIKLADLLEAFKYITEDFYSTIEQELSAKKKDKLISREEAAEQLGVSPQTLWRWDKNKYLCATRLGASLRYHQCDIDQIKGKRG